MFFYLEVFLLGAFIFFVFESELTNSFTSTVSFQYAEWVNEDGIQTLSWNVMVGKHE